MNVPDVFSETAFAPGRVINRIFDERAAGAGLAGFFLGSLCLFLWLGMSGVHYSAVTGTLLFICIFFLQTAAGAAAGGLTHFFMEIMGGRGSAAGLFAILGLSNMLWSLLLPVSFIRGAMGGSLAGAGWAVFVIALAQMFAAAVMIRRGYRAPAWKSWAAVLLSCAFPIMLASFAFLTALSLAMSVFSF